MDARQPFFLFPGVAWCRVASRCVAWRSAAFCVVTRAKKRGSVPTESLLITYDGRTIKRGKQKCEGVAEASFVGLHADAIIRPRADVENPDAQPLSPLRDGESDWSSGAPSGGGSAEGHKEPSK